MSDRYLWDRSGKPDPDVERFEKLLSPFGLQSGTQTARRRNYGRLAAFAAAAVLILAAAAAWHWTRQPAITTWQAVRVYDGQTSAPSAVYAGQHIAADSRSRIELRSDKVGQVQLEPGSELYVRESTPTRQLLSLRRGVLHALIWAPPSQFAVDTPGVRAVDLGCSYTLETQENGDGRLTVQMGWVAFDHQRHESFIPAGAACRVYAGRGPGIPCFEDAPPALQTALTQWERTAASVDLTAVLAAARPHDALTLWHLLSRAPAADRALVYDRFAQLAQLSPAIDRHAVLAGDTHALDQCWDALQLGDTSWWRTWKQSW